MSDFIFPTEKKENNQGWVLSYAFLQSVKDEIYDYGHCPDLEGIELVLLAPPVIRSIYKEISRLKAENEQIRIDLEYSTRSSLDPRPMDRYAISRLKEVRTRHNLDEILKGLMSD